MCNQPGRLHRLRAGLRAWFGRAFSWVAGHPGAKAGALIVLLGLFGLLQPLRSLDFGFHWDEPRLINAASDSMKAGRLLPGWYNYPSLSYDIELLALTPKAVPIAWHARKAALSVPWEYGYNGVKKRVDRFHSELTQGLDPYIRAERTKLYLRGVFAFLTMLGPLWTGLGVWLYRKRPFEAALACALVALSWEVGYHARWIAPDGLVMSFSALMLMCLAGARGSNRPGRWLYGAAAAASLAFSAKYTAGALFFVVLGAAVAQSFPGARLRTVAARLLTCTAVFAGLFVLLSPGVFLEPLKAIADIAYERWHYAEEGHVGLTVDAGIKHLGLELKWLGTAMFSHYPAVSLLFSGCALLGAGSMLRREPVRCALLLGPIAFYLLYFCAQRTMVVRNLLILVPFAATLSARGVSWACDHLARWPRAKWAVPAVVLVGVVLNMYWLHTAATSVMRRGKKDPVAAFAKWAEKQPKTRLRLSKHLCTQVGKGCEGYRARGNDKDCRVAFWASDIQPRAYWPSNWTHYELPTGPFEVNLDYYALWESTDRIVMLPCLGMPEFFVGRFAAAEAK